MNTRERHRSRLPTPETVLQPPDPIPQTSWSAFQFYTETIALNVCAQAVSHRFHKQMTDRFKLEIQRQLQEAKQVRHSGDATAADEMCRQAKQETTALNELVRRRPPRPDAETLEAAAGIVLRRLQAAIRDKTELDRNHRFRWWTYREQALGALGTLYGFSDTKPTGVAKTTLKAERRLVGNEILTVCFGVRIRPTDEILKNEADRTNRHVAYHDGDGCGRVHPEGRLSQRQRCDRCQKKVTSRRKSEAARLKAQAAGIFAYQAGTIDDTAVITDVYGGPCSRCGDWVESPSQKIRQCDNCAKSHRATTKISASRI